MAVRSGDEQRLEIEGTYHFMDHDELRAVRKKIGEMRRIAVEIDQLCEPARQQFLATRQAGFVLPSQR